MRAIICLRMGSDNGCALGGKPSKCVGFENCAFWIKAEIELDHHYTLVPEEEEILNL